MRIEPIRGGTLRSRHPARVWAAYHTGSWAWILHRLSGLLILAYLYFHLIVLSSALWTGGIGQFNRTVASLTTPPFIIADLALFVVVLYHALNGIRVMLMDLGWGIERQKALFWAMMGVGGVAMAAAAVALLPLMWR